MSKFEIEIENYGSLEELNNELFRIAESYIDQNFERVEDVRRMGMDPRAFYNDPYISREGIVVEKRSQRVAEYYGGLEYVDDEYKSDLGNYIFYSAEDSRVKEHVDDYYCPTEEESLV